MWNRRRKQFICSIAGAGIVAWLAAYGAFSGPKAFLFDVNITDVLLVCFSGLLFYATLMLYDATKQLRRVAERQDQRPILHVKSEAPWALLRTGKAKTAAAASPAGRR